MEMLTLAMQLRKHQPVSRLYLPWHHQAPLISITESVTLLPVEYRLSFYASLQFYF
jgi:hypothetical protein